MQGGGGALSGVAALALALLPVTAATGAAVGGGRGVVRLHAVLPLLTGHGGLGEGKDT